VSPAGEWAAANKSWRRQVLFQRRKNLLIFESELKAGLVNAMSMKKRI
tara:strand:- start:195 stop:338 length:144 start_codon:yes stop_codon:yes gene_type:complete